MISIILERRMGRFKVKPKYNRASRFTTARRDIKVPNYDPSGKVHAFKGNRGSMDTYNRSTSSLMGSNQFDKLPKTVLVGILLKIFPKIFKRKGDILDIGEMNRTAMDSLNANAMNFVERNKLVCILYTERTSAWYSFKDKKVYDLYNSGRFSMFRRTLYREWEQDVLKNKHKMFKLNKR